MRKSILGENWELACQATRGDVAEHVKDLLV